MLLFENFFYDLQFIDTNCSSQMFDNIASIKFSPTSSTTTVSSDDETTQKIPRNLGVNGVLVVGMVSGEGEEMRYKKDVVVEGRVERWMGEVEREMKHSNRLITKEALFYYGSSNKNR